MTSHFEINLAGLRFQRDPMSGPDSYRSQIQISKGGQAAVYVHILTNEIANERVTQVWRAPSEFDAGTVIELDDVRYMRIVPGGWIDDAGATWKDEHFDGDETRSLVRVVTAALR